MNTDFKNIEMYVRRVVDIYKDKNFNERWLYGDEPIREDPIKYVAGLITDEILNEVEPTKDNVLDMSSEDVIYFATLLKTDIVWCSGDYISKKYDEDCEAHIIIRYDEKAIAKDPVLKRTGMNAFDIYGGLLREARSYVFAENSSDREPDDDDINDVGIHTASVPFYKFMNEDQTEEYSTENIHQRIENAKYVEFTDKLDGCFAQMFYDNDAVHMTTACSLGFSEIWNDCNEWLKAHDIYSTMVRENPEYTFMFEAIFPSTHHIVNYDSSKEGLHLIGMRNKMSGKIARYSMLKAMQEQYDINVVNQLYFIDADSIHDYLDSVDGTIYEGVVANIDGFLVKLKTKDYLNLVSFSRDNGHLEDAIIKCWDNDTTDDLERALPVSTKPQLTNVYKKINEYCELANEIMLDAIVNSSQLDISEVEKYADAAPKCIRTTVKLAIYRRMKGDDYKCNFLRDGNKTIRYKKLVDGIEELKQWKQTLM